MGLKQLDLHRSYDSYSDNISDFFNNVLDQSTKYLRAAAYFSSTSIKVLSRGLKGLIRNNGQVKMLVSVIISDKDQEAIMRGITNKEDIISNIFTEEQLIQSLSGDDSTESLYELILSGKLAMKFILSKRGIFHMKFGIVTDNEGNAISFSGSVNETAEGYEVNGEEFKVFRSWVNGEGHYVSDDLGKFNNYWNGLIPIDGVMTSSLPDSVRGRISKVVSDFKLKKGQDMPKLRHYQESAIEKWESNGFKGIIEMATGTGKTRVALEIIRKTVKKRAIDIVVVAVPTKELVYQWIENLKSSHLVNPTEAVSSNVKTILKTLDKASWEDSGSSILSLVGTYSFFSREDIADRLNLHQSRILFIADEVHGAGAPTYSRSLSNEFVYRLGLSATPARYFDEEGTNTLLGYFGGIVFTYTLKNAIEDGYLTPFSYYPIFAYLQDAELEEYKKITRKYANSNYAGEDDEGSKPLEILLFQRARIVKKAKDKLSKVDEVLTELVEDNDIGHTLIYFEDNDQIQQSNFILDRKNVKYGIISADTDKAQRDSLFSRFRSGDIDCLCSMKVLDLSLIHI